MSSRCNNHEDTKKFKKLSVRNLRSKRLKACKADINLANINSLVVNNTEIQNATVNNLNTDHLLINGQDVTCSLFQAPVENLNTGFDPTGPVDPACSMFVNSSCPLKPAGVNEDVWNCILQNAVAEGQDLQQRLFEGRTIINSYLDSQGCSGSCPPAPREPVPVEIFATKSFPVFKRRFCPGVTGATGILCGVTGATGTTDTIMSNITFNLDVNYQLEVAESVDARVVSVLVQLAYIDPAGGTGGCTGGSGENIIVETVFIGNRQFYPTLDVEYGENYAGVVQIPTAVVAAAIAAMPDPCDTGCVQLVVYKEQGVCIWTATDSGFECRGGGGATTNNAPTGAQVVARPGCPNGNQPFCSPSGCFC
jgi:hypothetical protein